MECKYSRYFANKPLYKQENPASQEKKIYLALPKPELTLSLGFLIYLLFGAFFCEQNILIYSFFVKDILIYR